MAKYEMDYDLKRRMSDLDWLEYQRLTVVANNPPWSELPVTRRLYKTGAVLTVLLLVPIVLAIANSTDGGKSVTPWIVAIIVMMFLTLFVPLLTVFPENRKAREKARDGRDTLARKVASKSSGDRGSYDDDDRIPHYPVTGEYNPGLYMARGGPAMAQWLEDTGYGDWDTYEANKPD